MMIFAAEVCTSGVYDRPNRLESYVETIFALAGTIGGFIVGGIVIGAYETWLDEKRGSKPFPRWDMAGAIIILVVIVSVFALGTLNIYDILFAIFSRN